MMYEQLMLEGLPPVELQEPLPSSRRDFHASLTALREKVEAIVMIVTCGEKSPALSENCAPVGSSVKIHPVYSQETISNISNVCSMILPRWGIRSVGGYGELVTSERPTGANASLFWLTPTATDGKRQTYKTESLAKHWKKKPNSNLAEQIAYMETFPTPLASNVWTCFLKSTQQREGSRKSLTLPDYVAMFPTPMATGWGCSGARGKLNKLKRGGVIYEEERHQMSSGSGGKLNPTWVEWLMGFPLGWTDLDALETQ